MIDAEALLEDLKPLLRQIEEDLHERTDSDEVPEVRDRLTADYSEARNAGRTAQSYEAWLTDYATQTAVAWVLSCVFARFLEDNGLVSPPKLAGPREQLARARDEHELYFREHPTHTDREYLLAVFNDLARLPGAAEIFGEHNALQEMPSWISGDAAGELLRFFQKIDAETGDLIHEFVNTAWNTRFLGDLYQDLSEGARKKYALLQTPKFVETFILDRTLDPALDAFGLDSTAVTDPDGEELTPAGFRMIDPACGSGHFLLGAFDRILDRWQRKEPGAKTIDLAQRTLDSIYGVDLNPFASAIAYFRLLLAALRASGVAQLKDAPDFQIYVATGDALLHGPPVESRAMQHDLFGLLDHHSYSEEPEALKRSLAANRYHAVVANPPYITVKDKAVSAVYREGFGACHGKYSVAIPFKQRMFDLAVANGYVGMITANSFMKREFGSKLIEQYIPKWDLTHVIDTSGAYIPGHGTPTAILLLRKRKPVASTVRTAMGIRGEPSTPDNPAEGLVWIDIVSGLDHPGRETDYISIADTDRTLFHTHPWTLSGGGAAELKERLEEEADTKLDEHIDTAGFASFTGQDDVFVMPKHALERLGVPPEFNREFVVGDTVRDWTTDTEDNALAPYDADLHPVHPREARWGHHVWQYRELLRNWNDFGGHRRLSDDEPWYAWYRWVESKLRTPLSITFGEVATHNHFVLDRGGKVFKQTAPVLKLPADATGDDHLALLGLLNSSVACFWMKKSCHCKGSTVDDRGARQTTMPFEDFYAFNSTKLKKLPLPTARPTEIARKLDTLATERAACLPGTGAEREVPTRAALDAAFATADAKRAEMVGWQERLDWTCYRLSGLLDDGTADACLAVEDPPLKLGERAFEIALARSVEAGDTTTTWFTRHGSTPIATLPNHWSDDYKQVVNARLDAIEKIKSINLIERPEFKRRWNDEPWERQEQVALQRWLLRRLESYFDLDGRMNETGTPTAQTDIALISVAQLADIASRDSEFTDVGALYSNDLAFNVPQLVEDLVRAESVPLLPALRYAASGLRKRKAWERTWALQRMEDEIDTRTELPQDDSRHLSAEQAKSLKQQEVGDIPVPPKYAKGDFISRGGARYWSLRGKLDVHKERWISFPHCESGDGTMVVCWAGHDHLQQAHAIAAYFVYIKEELGGDRDPRLVPLLACLIELLPWLKQWHHAIDPEYNMRMDEHFDEFVQEEARQLNLTLDQIVAWTPR